jgi:hypothetical protein
MASNISAEFMKPYFWELALNTNKVKAAANNDFIMAIKE